MSSLASSPWYPFRVSTYTHIVVLWKSPRETSSLHPPLVEKKKVYDVSLEASRHFSVASDSQLDAFLTSSDVILFFFLLSFSIFRHGVTRMKHHSLFICESFQKNIWNLWYTTTFAVEISQPSSTDVRNFHGRFHKKKKNSSYNLKKKKKNIIFSDAKKIIHSHLIELLFFCQQNYCNRINVLKMKMFFPLLKIPFVRSEDKFFPRIWNQFDNLFYWN